MKVYTWWCPSVHLSDGLLYLWSYWMTLYWFWSIDCRWWGNLHFPFVADIQYYLETLRNEKSFDFTIRFWTGLLCDISSSHWGPCSNPGRSLWNLLRTKLHCYRISPQSIYFPSQCHSTSTSSHISFICHLGYIGSTIYNFIKWNTSLSQKFFIHQQMHFLFNLRTL
jgi:hypothetical protein